MRCINLIGPASGSGLALQQFGETPVAGASYDPASDRASCRRPQAPRLAATEGGHERARCRSRQPRKTLRSTAFMVSAATSNRRVGPEQGAAIDCSKPRIRSPSRLGASVAEPTWPLRRSTNRFVGFSLVALQDLTPAPRPGSNSSTRRRRPRASSSSRALARASRATDRSRSKSRPRRSLSGAGGSATDSG